MVVTSFMLALALTLVVIQKSREPDQVTLTFYHQDDIIYVDLKRLEVRFEVEDTVIKARDLVHLAGIVEEVSSDLTLLSLSITRRNTKHTRDIISRDNIFSPPGTEQIRKYCEGP